MTIFKSLKGAFSNSNKSTHQLKASNNENGNNKTSKQLKSSGSSNNITTNSEKIKDLSSINKDEVSTPSVIPSKFIHYIDDENIEWPDWFNSIVNNSDTATYTLISRNGLDDENERSKKGFKGRNFVYQDRKFMSKFYWKGKSTLVNNSSNNVILPTILVNNNGLDYKHQQYENRKLIGIIYWKNNCEGPPGCVHGGALASLFDDSMACCIRYFYNNNYNEDEPVDAINNNTNNLEINNLNSNSLSINNKFLSKIENNDSSIPNTPRSNNSNIPQTNYAVTANLSVNYKKFVDLESYTYIETKIQKREGRKIFISSTMKDQNGSIRADATAVWIVIQIGSTSPNTQSGDTSPNNNRD